MQHVIHDPSTNKIDFHACMWGRHRNKKTSFLTNSNELESLRKTCNHQKWEHDSWGVKWGKNRWKFATEDECEYPKELCNQVAKAIATETQVASHEPPAKRKQRSRHSSAAAAERATVRNTHQATQSPRSHTGKTTIRVRHRDEPRSRIPLGSPNWQPPRTHDRRLHQTPARRQDPQGH